MNDLTDIVRLSKENIGWTKVEMSPMAYAKAMKNYQGVMKWLNMSFYKMDQFLFEEFQQFEGFIKWALMIDAGMDRKKAPIDLRIRFRASFVSFLQAFCAINNSCLHTAAENMYYILEG